MTKNFLSAEWHNLVMVNYEVTPKLLEKYIPYQTELDLWKGKCFISLVGFLFKNTKVLGIPIPGHINFEEVNLRFYVRHQTPEGEWRRGVVFIKEVVPRRAITWVANTLYGEHYQTMKMDHKIESDDIHQEVTYRWRYKKSWNHLKVKAAKEALSVVEDSEAEFITDHYWGYTRRGPQTTSSYEVVHPPWKVYTVDEYDLHCDGANIYGQEFGTILRQKPSSIFMAEGSEVFVKRGKKL